jgi:DNA-directed RNA polymerase I subunit RPA43
MSTEQDAAQIKEQRRKEKKERKRKELAKSPKSSKKRAAVEIEDDGGNGAQENITQHRSPSPAKRLRTTEPASQDPIVQVPDSQDQPLPGDFDSPFHGINASVRVNVPPQAMSYPVEGLCTVHLSPLLLTWNAQLKGVVMAYNNVKLTSKPSDDPEDTPLALHPDETASPFIYLHAHFLILRPALQSHLPGLITIQNESSISLVLYNLFSVSIPRKYLPKDWVWDERAGVRRDAQGNEWWGGWRDGSGKKVGGVLRFRVRDFDVEVPSGDGGGGGFMSLEGSLLSKEEDEEADEAVNGAGEGEREGVASSSRTSGSRAR